MQSAVTASVVLCFLAPFANASTGSTAGKQIKPVGHGVESVAWCLFPLAMWSGTRCAGQGRTRMVERFDADCISICATKAFRRPFWLRERQGKHCLCESTHQVCSLPWLALSAYTLYVYCVYHSVSPVCHACGLRPSIHYWHLSLCLSVGLPLHITWEPCSLTKYTCRLIHGSSFTCIIIWS